MIYQSITDLIEYAVERGLIESCDRIWAENRILSALKLSDWDKSTGKYKLEVHTHDYESVITPPTCTEQGYTTHNCKTCGDSYVDTYVDSLGHTYDNDKDTNCNFCNEAREINFDSGCGAMLSRGFCLMLLPLGAAVGVFCKKKKH